MKTVDFLDAVRRKYALTSDYQLAKKLGFSTSRIALYRTTPRELDDEACLQVAAALEMPPEYVMACIAAARAKSTEARRAWTKAAKMLKAGTAAAILTAAVFLSGEPGARAESAAAPQCILRQIRKAGARRRGAAVLPLAEPPPLTRRRARRGRRPSQIPLLPGQVPIVA